MPKYLIVSPSLSDQEAQAQTDAAGAQGYVRGVPPRYASLQVGDVIDEPSPSVPSERPESAAADRALDAASAAWTELTTAQRWAVVLQLIGHVRRQQQALQTLRQSS